MDAKEVKARVEAKVKAGDFFFPEDLQRGVAEALGIDLTGTPLSQDAAADSKTRGSVPPWSGRPATPDAATKESEQFIKKYDEAQAKRSDAPERVTYAETGDPNEKLEDEVKEQGPVYPDQESTSTTSESDNKTTKTSKAKGK